MKNQRFEATSRLVVDWKTYVLCWLLSGHWKFSSLFFDVSKKRGVTLERSFFLVHFHVKSYSTLYFQFIKVDMHV